MEEKCAVCTLPNEGPVDAERHHGEALLLVVLLRQGFHLLLRWPLNEVAGPGGKSFGHLCDNQVGLISLDSVQVTSLDLCRKGDIHHKHACRLIYCIV